MIEFRLNMRPAQRAVHSAAAWFIPGGDVNVWLEEMSAWGLPLSRLRLFVIPTSLADRTAIGVLAQTPSGVAPAATRRARPYAEVGGRLYLPVDALLVPAPSETELREKLRQEVNVLHPSSGLVGFAREDAIGVADLLGVAQPRPANWNHAICGIAAPKRLIAVEPDQPPQLIDIVEAGRDDIGSESVQEAPRSPDERPLREAARRASSAPLAWGARLLLGSLNLLHKLGGLMPRRKPKAPRKGSKPPPAPNSPKPAPPAGLRGWLWRKIQLLSKPLNEARLHELRRLQRMLENDPDLGLRYAIALRDDGTRGSAAQTDKLAPRDVNFNLRNALGSGRPADPWHIPTDIRQSLQQRYREAANRELNLGRHRRAAFIFAELLGDYSSAANALEQGRYFREAAVLYRDRLNNRLKAAECLEHGGLLSEAIEIYGEMHWNEKAGDLCTTLERTDEASRFYRLQVENDRRRSDLLPAARLLETKLGAPDEALQLLTDGWPASKEAGECLLESFQLLGRLARHEEASSRISQLRQSALDPERATAAAKILADLSSRYPQAGVRIASADATRVIAGRELSRSESSNRATLARAVARLAPEDRLLSRDAERFSRAGAGAPSAKPAQPPAGVPFVIRQFALSSALAWRTAVFGEDGFYALAVQPANDQYSTVRVIRGSWDGKAQTGAHLILAPSDPDRDWTLHPVPGMSHLIVMPPRPDMAPRTPTLIGIPTGLQNGVLPWLPSEGVLALSIDEHAVAWVLRAVSSIELALSAHAVETGSILYSHTVPEGFGVPDERVRMVSRNGRVCITFPWGVLRFTRTLGFERELTATPVRQLAVTFPNERFLLAAAQEIGCRLLSSETGRNQPFGEGLVEPLLTFTRGSWVIAADAHGHVYQTENGRAVWRGAFAVPNPLIAITPTNMLREFATFAANGTVTVYGIRQ